MDYLLMSGATGLVGRYLLRDLVRTEVPVAVLVRDSKLASAASRIESIMLHWEAEAGHALPRPVVLPSDLCVSDLQLADSHRRWIADRCHSVLHCAASMTFRENRHGEPFRTNIGGTENVLRLCREAGIRKFHHVSTAYVCGLREGRVWESELDVGQQLGNVYEQSKLQAEKLVRNAEYLDERTIYRPASVIGDAKTGYVTNPHGFYLPLQMAYVMASKVPVDRMNERFFEILGLSGDEGKNLVPVDWLSRAIVTLVTDSRFHGQTYHLASAHPVKVGLIQQVIQDAVRRYHPGALRSSAETFDVSAYDSLYQKYMAIYRSHWRDDPTFDQTNVEYAIPDDPCPALDYDTLLRIARYPIVNQFNLADQPSISSHLDVTQHLKRFAQRTNGNPSDTSRIGLQVNGAGGGQWELSVSEGRITKAEQGLGTHHGARVYMTSDTFRSLLQRRLSIQQSIGTGKVLLEGEAVPWRNLVTVLKQLASSH